MKFKSRIRRACVAASLLTGIVVSFAVRRAEAAVVQVSCNVSKVRFYKSSLQLVIFCSNQTDTYSLFVNPDAGAVVAACGADFGAVKAMESLAQAARVAGASLTINYTDVTGCGPAPYHVLVSTNL